MKSFITIVLVICGLAFLGLRYYLSNYASKVEVYSWESNYGVTLPLRMQALPKTTGDFETIYDKSRDRMLKEIDVVKEDKKVQFNAWLKDQQTRLEEKAREEAHKLVDQKFGTGKDSEAVAASASGSVQ